jgi:hypothetical protein
MRLTQIAFALTFLLLGATVYLAWQAREESRGAREQVELFKRQQQAQRDVGKSANSFNNPSTMKPPVPGQVALENTQPPAIPAAPKNEMATIPGGAPVIPTQPAAATLPVPPPAEPSAIQKKIMAMPTIAKVKEYQADAGFTVITAGKNQRVAKGTQFDLRRENAVVGRITVGDVIEADESIADLDPKSIPAGVTVMVGDEVIQVVLP